MPFISRFLRLLAAAVFLAVAIPGAWAQAPAVATDIKPIAGLVAAVMDGVGAPARLIPDNDSPHHHALRPSDALMLARADLVFWMGPDLAPSLADALPLSRTAEVVHDLSALPGLTRLPIRAGGLWGASGDEHDDHGDEADPHLWLAPANAKAMARHVAAVLTARDPGNGPRYADNLARLVAAIDEAVLIATARLEPVKDTPYLVHHDAYRYFEAAFGLSPIGSISGSHAQQPGAGRLARLRELVAERDIGCVFTEPGADIRTAEMVAGLGQARVAPLDPLGRDLAVGPGYYPALIGTLTETVVDCLAPRRCQARRRNCPLSIYPETPECPAPPSSTRPSPRCPSTPTAWCPRLPSNSTPARC